MQNIHNSEVMRMMIGKKELVQYQNLQKEIRDLENRIKRLENDKDATEYGVVKASSKSFPFTEHLVRVSGATTGETKTTIERRRINKINLKYLFENKKSELVELQLEIEKFINDIPDSTIRHVFRLRYYDKMSWQKIAFEIGKHDESYPRQEIHDKYLDKIKSYEETEKTELKVI